jgi:hypothetical protein
MRRLSVLGLLPMLLLALAGCGTKAADAATIVRSAPAKTTDAKTARMALTVDGTSGTTNINATGDGVIDIVGKRGDLTMDVGQAGLGKLHVLMFGTNFYMQLPAQLQGQIPGGKPFLKIDLAAASKQQGIDLGALSQQNPDASSQLAFLNGAGADFKKVGTEKIRGTATTHYAGTVDLAKAAAAVKTPEQKTALEKAQQQLGISTFPMDVWVDGQGRMRKMTYQMDLSKAAAQNGSQPGGVMHATMELFDYGVKVNVTEPPPDQVTDLSALLGQLGGGSGSKRP